MARCNIDCNCDWCNVEKFCKAIDKTGELDVKFEGAYLHEGEMRSKDVIVYRKGQPATEPFKARIETQDEAYYREVTVYKMGQPDANPIKVRIPNDRNGFKVSQLVCECYEYFGLPCFLKWIGDAGRGVMPLPNFHKVDREARNANQIRWYSR